MASENRQTAMSNFGPEGNVSEVLRQEFQNYLAHQDEFVAKYDGRVIALKDGVVLGDYDTAGSAMLALQDAHPLGTYLIQKVSPGNRDTTVSIYSPVVAP